MIQFQNVWMPNIETPRRHPRHEVTWFHQIAPIKHSSYIQKISNDIMRCVSLNFCFIIWSSYLVLFEFLNPRAIACTSRNYGLESHQESDSWLGPKFYKHESPHVTVMCCSQGFVFDIDNIKLILKSERWMLIVLGQVYMSIMLMSCISISTSRAISNKNALSRFRLQFDSFTESKLRLDHLLYIGVSWSLDVKIYNKLCEFHFMQMLNSHTFII